MSYKLSANSEVYFMTAYEVAPSRERECSDDRYTFSDTYTPPITTGLPKTIESICPECFADSNTNPYQPDYEDVVKMMQNLRGMRPVPAEAVQFMGGEPTIHPRFLDIVRAAKDMGFKHIQVASNGIKLADPDFAVRAREAGLQYIYLQMDGVDDEVFKKIRGRALLETKLA